MDKQDQADAAQRLLQAAQKQCEVRRCPSATGRVPGRVPGLGRSPCLPAPPFTPPTIVSQPVLEYGSIPEGIFSLITYWACCDMRRNSSSRVFVCDCFSRCIVGTMECL